MFIKSKYSFMGIGDWGLGIGDWGLGPIPNPQSPKNILIRHLFIKIYIKLFNKKLLNYSIKNEV